MVDDLDAIELLDGVGQDGLDIFAVNLDVARAAGDVFSFSSFKMTSPRSSSFLVTSLRPSDMVRSKSSRTIPAASFLA